MREELLRHLYARQMAEQDAMGMQSAFRLTRGAGGVDDHGRIVGPRIGGGVAVGGLCHLGFEIEMASAADDEDLAQVRQRAADRFDLVDVLRVGDENARAAVAEAVLQRLGAELMKSGSAMAPRL